VIRADNDNLRKLHLADVRFLCRLKTSNV